MRKKMVLFIGIALLVGCGTDPNLDITPPDYVEQMPSKYEEDRYYEGSLFAKNQNALFSDRKAMRVNDILTVIINEKTSQSSKANKATNRTNHANLGGGLFAGSEKIQLNKLNSYTNIGFETNSSANFAGSGSSSRSDNFTTTISARVIKVMSNGNYFIAGEKEILINDEKQIIKISGVVRPFDITQNNQITSDKISDAKIIYQTQGDIDRNTTKPWGSKVLDIIWPF